MKTVLALSLLMTTSIFAQPQQLDVPTQLHVPTQNIQQLANLVHGQPTPEGQLFLESTAGPARWYVSFTVLPPFGALDRIAFTHEIWTAKGAKVQIDQWVFTALPNGMVSSLWHSRILEKDSRVLSVKPIPYQPAEAQTALDAIVARFLAP